MKLIDLVRRSAPAPWAEADNIPWSEPGFSERMLREHLSPDHDRASRRARRIDRQVRWIHEHVLGAQPARVLDLACGPGLYTERLARLGHQCLGIDFSPASIAHARAQAEGSALSCRYVEADIRSASYGERQDLCMFVHGEFSSLRPADAEAVLRRAHAAVAAGGQIVVEAHTLEAVRAIGSASPVWHTAPSGLFSDRPHLVLKESAWDGAQAAATERYFVVDLETGSARRLATSTQGYSEAEYRGLLEAAGFSNVDFLVGMGDAEDARADGLVTVLARRH